MLLNILTVAVILGLLAMDLLADAMYRESFSAPYSAFDDDYDCR